MLNHFIAFLFPDPAPCPCGCRNIWTVYVGGGYDGLLPFWARMKCPSCGRHTKKKLFRCRAVQEWNKSLMRCKG